MDGDSGIFFWKKSPQEEDNSPQGVSRSCHLLSQGGSPEISYSLKVLFLGELLSLIEIYLGQLMAGSEAPMQSPVLSQ